MRAFLLMLSFFTRIPVPQVQYSDRRYVMGIPMLPFVGLVTGAVLYAASFADRRLPMPAVSLLVFALYLLITGGIHLDGFGDSCDALFSSRDREKMLEIMKDPRSGSFGVLGLIFVSAAYLILLCYAGRPAFLLFPVIGKCTPVIAANLAEYIRPRGMAELFCRSAGKGVLIFTVCVGLAFCAAFGFIYILAAAGSMLLCIIACLRVKAVLGGITGDILGMLCELTQTAFLLICTLKIFE